MIFVIGGEFAGKERFVKNTFSIEKAEKYDVSYDVLKSAAAVRDFHLRTRDFMREGKNIKAEIDRLLNDNPDIIIMSDEIGCGVVPIDKYDREYRDESGRVNCYLADMAESVFRVVCGIGVKIK